MTLTLRLLSFSIVLAAGTMALGYAVSRLWLWAFLNIMVGVLWFLGTWKNWDWPATVFLICFVGTAVRGIWGGIGAGWMLIGLVAALSAWDLNHFFHRLQLAQKDDVIKELEYGHLRRLLIVDCLGVLLAGVALIVKIKAGFGVILFLTAVAIVCLSRFINLLRRESD